MGTVTELYGGPAVPRQRATGPSEFEVAAVDAGLNDALVVAETEPLSDDPLIAVMQADRERAAALGDFEAAERLHEAIEDLRQVQVRDDEIELDDEPEVE